MVVSLVTRYSPMRLEIVRLDLEVTTIGTDERDIRSRVRVGVSDLVVVAIAVGRAWRVRHDQAMEKKLCSRSQSLRYV